MGKSSLEPAILHEVHCYIDHFIKPNLGEPIKVSDSLMLATANVMGSMILSNRRDYKDANFLSWMHSFGDSVKAAMIAAVARNIPGAAYLPGDLTGKISIRSVCFEFVSLFRKHFSSFFSGGLTEIYCYLVSCCDDPRAPINSGQSDK